MQLLKDKVAIVTGGSSGFGLMTAIAFAQEGARVVATVRTRESARELEEAARTAGVKVSIDVIDLAHPGRVADACRTIIAREGRVDVLVNNAGGAVFGFFETQSQALLDETMAVNFASAVEMMRAVTPDMRARGHGRIINISSVNGFVGMPGLNAYCASKFALEGFSESLWGELQPYGVDVVLIQPGAYKTPAWGKNRRATEVPEGSPYFARNQRVQAGLDKMLAGNNEDPAEVVRLIVHAATTKRPKLRYLSVPASMRVGLWLMSHARLVAAVAKSMGR